MKTGAGAILALTAVVMLPLSFVSWAEDQTEEQIAKAVLIAEGREQVIHSKQAAKHDYDFYEIRAQQTEWELIGLEEDVDAGVQLTATQSRKMNRLAKQLDDFEEHKELALKRLSDTEHADEKEEN